MDICNNHLRQDINKMSRVQIEVSHKPRFKKKYSIVINYENNIHILS